MGVDIFTMIEYRDKYTDSGWNSGTSLNLGRDRSLYQVLGNAPSSQEPKFPFIGDCRLEPLRKKDEDGDSPLSFEVSYAFHGMLELWGEDAYHASYVTLAELIAFRNDPIIQEKIYQCVEERTFRYGSDKIGTNSPNPSLDYIIEALEIHRDFYVKWLKISLSRDDIRLMFFIDEAFAS
jgi:hypothetical protein